MKILMLLDIPSNTGSWIGRYYPLAKELAKRGNFIKILCPHYDYFQLKKKNLDVRITDRIVIKYIGPTFFKETKESRSYYATTSLTWIVLGNLMKMVKESIRSRFDIIYVCKPLPVASTAGIIIRVMKRKPIIVDCDDYEVYTNFLQNKVQKLIIRFFEDNFPKVCNAIITNTRFTQNRLKSLKICARKIFYIPNGIDEERFKNPVYPAIYTKIKNKKIILYFGDLNISTGHNVDILLRAFRYILKVLKRENIVLVIVGDGKDEGYLKELSKNLGIEKEIFWTGRVAPDEIVDYLFIANVVVDPVDKRYKGNFSRCPLKILEAMYIDKPVVTSNIGDRKILLGNCGTLVEEGNDMALAKGILKSLNNGNLQMKLKMRMRENIKDYKWSVLVKKLEKISIKLMES